RAGPGQVIVQIVRNPLVMAVFIGVAVNLAGLGPHIDRMPLLDILGRAGLPLGLLTVGAGLDLASLRAAGGRALWTTVVKLAIMPVAMGAICAALAIDPASTALMVLFSALPTSATGHILARQLGGDVPTMTSIITLQTALSMITLTVAAALLT
ncbi:MAG: AEC family transporter, partial [Alphaproteobacteria bacterium]